jgi:hypothetical protein
MFFFETWKFHYSITGAKIVGQQFVDTNWDTIKDKKQCSNSTRLQDRGLLATTHELKLHHNKSLSSQTNPLAELFFFERNWRGLHPTAYIKTKGSGSVYRKKKKELAELRSASEDRPAWTTIVASVSSMILWKPRSAALCNACKQAMSSA